MPLGVVRLEAWREEGVGGPAWAHQLARPANPDGSQQALCLGSSYHRSRSARDHRVAEGSPDLDLAPPSSFSASPRSSDCPDVETAGRHLTFAVSDVRIWTAQQRELFCQLRDPEGNEFCLR